MPWLDPIWPALAESWPTFLAAAALLLLSAAFSAAEKAFCSLAPEDLAEWRPSDADSRAARAARGAARLQRLRQDLPRLLLTLLFLNLTVNILFFSMEPRLARAIGGSASTDDGWPLGAGMLAAIIVFGEVIPKNLAAWRHVRMARFLAPILCLPHRLLTRPLAFLGAVARFAERAAGTRAPGSQAARDDVRLLIRQAGMDGALDAAEQDALERILGFADLKVRDAMTHRTRAVTIDAGHSAGEAVARSRKSGFSRLPVRDPRKDEWVGWVDARILALDADPSILIQKRGLDPPRYFPEAGRADQALAAMLADSVPMAFAVDERGSVTGLLTPPGLYALLTR